MRAIREGGFFGGLLYGESVAEGVDPLVQGGEFLDELLEGG